MKNSKLISSIVFILVLCAAFVEMIYKHAKSPLTAADVQYWDLLKDPSDESASKVNDWIGGHPKATISEFEAFAYNIDAESQKHKTFYEKYPNATNLPVN